MYRISMRRIRSSTATRRFSVVVAMLVGATTLGVTTTAFGSVDRPTVTGPAVAPEMVNLAAARTAAAADHRLAIAKAKHVAKVKAAKKKAAKKKAAKLRAEKREAARAAAARKAAAERATRAAAAVRPGTNRALGKQMAAARGWGDAQFVCLDKLWTRESGWSQRAANSSGAYGIPQALPGSKMASAGSDWATNPKTQITWGLNYVGQRYGTPCGAWSAFLAKGWY